MSSAHGAVVRRVVAAFFAVATVFAVVVLGAPSASAHPLDEYVVATYVDISAGGVEVELDLSPGVLLAPAVLGAIDTNGDRQLSAAETGAYLDSALRQVDVTVDGAAVALTSVSTKVPSYLAAQAGYGTFQVVGRGTHLSAGGEHTLALRNGFSPAKATYQVNAVVDKTGVVVVGAQDRSATQQQTTIAYRVASGTTAAGDSASSTGSSVAAAGAGGLQGLIENPSSSIALVLLAFGSAVLLGGLHALTPGHAKTLIAAYLVGSGGTVRNAATLGLVVTFTHTASVVAIGLVALLASQLIVPSVLVPVLGVVSGLLVLVIGVRLLRVRLRAVRLARAGSGGPGERPTTALVPVGAAVTDAAHGDGHGRTPEHGREHQHGTEHTHGGSTHTHELPAEGITPRSLVAMGISGGLVPCPEALGVMILAVGLGRIGLGLGLIVAFSVGLAAVLVGLGVLLVRARPLVQRIDRLDGRWLTLLPVVSAVVVTGLGIGLLVTALRPVFTA